MGSFKYCKEHNEQGECANIAMANSDYCSTHATGHLQTMINHYSKSRIALKKQVETLKEINHHKDVHIDELKQEVEKLEKELFERDQAKSCQCNSLKDALSQRAFEIKGAEQALKNVKIRRDEYYQEMCDYKNKYEALLRSLPVAR